MLAQSGGAQALWALGRTVLRNPPKLEQTSDIFINGLLGRNTFSLDPSKQADDFQTLGWLRNSACSVPANSSGHSF
jgi:hypothetical protein